MRQSTTRRLQDPDGPKRRNFMQKQGKTQTRSVPLQTASQPCRGRKGPPGASKLRGLLETIKLNQMRATKDEKDAYEGVKEEVQTLRKRGKKYTDDLKKTYFFQDPKVADEIIRSLYETRSTIWA